MEESDATIYQQFTEAFFRNRRRYCNFAMSFIRNETEAELIVDECFLRFWEKRDTIEREKFESYFYAALKNNCLEWLRKKLRQQEIRSELYDRSQRLRKHDISTLDAFDIGFIFRSEIRDITLQTLKCLSGRTRSVFLDSRFHNLTHDQIAKKYGIPKYKVKREIMVALESLRFVLKDYLPLTVVAALFLFSA